MSNRPVSSSAVLWVDDDEKYPSFHQAQLEENGFQILKSIFAVGPPMR